MIDSNQNNALCGKYGIEMRIWPLSQDNSHSWVRISDGAKKYVVDSNYNNTEVPADLPEEQASQSSVRVVPARSKAKSKTTTERTCSCAKHHSDE